MALVGVALAILAIVRDDRRIAWAAMVVLIVALAMRLYARRKQQADPEDPPEV